MLKTKKEIERKFILKRFPEEIKTDKTYKLLDIKQYYFLMDGIQQRFRIAFDGKKTKYIHTIKRKIRQGINDESEGTISERAWKKIFFTDERTEHGKLIEKERHIIKYKKLKFEVDVYKKVHLITLEVELPDLNHPIDFPPVLKNIIIADVTNVKGFSNFAMAENF